MAGWPTGAAFAVSGVVAAAFDARNVAAIDQAHLSALAWGLALVGAPVGTVAASPLAPVAVARWGSRPVVVFAGLAYALAVMAPATARSLWTLAAGLAVLGATNLCLDVALASHVDATEKAADGGRPPRLACEAALSAGWIAGGVAGAVGAAAHLALAANLAIVSGLSAVVILASATRLDAGSPPTRTREPGKQLRAFFALPRRAWVLGSLAAAALLGEGVMLWWSSLLMARVQGPPWGVAGFAFGMGAGQAAAHWLRLLQRWGSVRLVRFGAVLAGGGAVLVLLGPGWPPTLLGIVLAGVGLAAPNALASAAGARISPYGAGLVSALGVAGLWVAGPLVGALAAAIGLNAGPALLGAAALAVVVLARTLGPTREPEPPCPYSLSRWAALRRAPPVTRR